MQDSVAAYLQGAVAWARQGREDQPLSEVWDAAEEAAVVLLRARSPVATARDRLTELLRGDANLRRVLRLLIREGAGAPWPEPLDAAAARGTAQLDLFDRPAPESPAERPPIQLDLLRGTGGTLGPLLGMEAGDGEVLQALIDLTRRPWADAWHKHVLAPWLSRLDAATVVRAGIWARTWQLGVGSTDAHP